MNKMIDPKAAKAHGIQLDKSGFPTTTSLQEWHRKNDPQLFDEQPREVKVPLWLIPLLPVVIVVLLILKSEI